MPNDFFSIHFSCLQGVHKPQSYRTETELAEALMSTMSCTRHYFWVEWYQRFIRAHGRLPNPYAGTLPIWDEALDERIKASKVKTMRQR